MSTRMGGAGSTCIDEVAQSEQAACHAETHFHVVREQCNVANPKNKLDCTTFRLCNLYANSQHFSSPSQRISALYATSLFLLLLNPPNQTNQ
mmetsp:Transcript_103312/g.296844  ORF Transcript_103312/g.296844 Transcript_103312/m.296844 type:complete len:92 (-) Transcript_103312:1742-2017(-)